MNILVSGGMNSIVSSKRPDPGPWKQRIGFSTSGSAAMGNTCSPKTHLYIWDSLGFTCHLVSGSFLRLRRRSSVPARRALALAPQRGSPGVCRYEEGSVYKMGFLPGVPKSPPAGVPRWGWPPPAPAQRPTPLGWLWLVGRSVSRLNWDCQRHDFAWMTVK